MALSIKDSDEMLGCKSLTLIHVYSIDDGAIRFCHVAREEEASPDCFRPIENQGLRCRHTSIEVHRAYLISDIITL